MATGFAFGGLPTRRPVPVVEAEVVVLADALDLVVVDEIELLEADFLITLIGFV